MSRATSQIQKYFQMHNVYKRSKNLYDIQKLNQQQRQLQAQRRKPPTDKNQLSKTRVQQSFTNSNQQINRRIDQNISSFKKRFFQQCQINTRTNTIHCDKSEISDKTNTRQTRSMRNKIKIKAPNLMKMMGRTELLSRKSIYNSQDQFNNYELSPPRDRYLTKIDIKSPRSKSSMQIVEPNPEYLQKSHQKDLNSLQLSHELIKNKFNTAIFRCLFDYSKSKKKIKKKQNVQYPKLISADKLESAWKNLQVHTHPGISQFYYSIGREPSQMDIRYNHQVYCKQLLKNARKIDFDFSLIQRKQQMLNKKLEEILNKKYIKDNRNQMCDYKFFNRESYRKKL